MKKLVVKEEDIGKRFYPAVSIWGGLYDQYIDAKEGAIIKSVSGLSFDVVTGRGGRVRLSQNHFIGAKIIGCNDSIEHVECINKSEEINEEKNMRTMKVKMLRGKHEGKVLNVSEYVFGGAIVILPNGTHRYYDSYLFKRVEDKVSIESQSKDKVKVVIDIEAEGEYQFATEADGDVEFHDSYQDAATYLKELIEEDDLINGSIYVRIADTETKMKANKNVIHGADTIEQ